MVGRSWSTQREPLHNTGEHAISTQKGPSRNSKQNLLAAIVRTIIPLCSPEKVHTNGSLGRASKLSKFFKRFCSEQCSACSSSYSIYKGPMHSLFPQIPCHIDLNTDYSPSARHSVTSCALPSTLSVFSSQLKRLNRKTSLRIQMVSVLKT